MSILLAVFLVVLSGYAFGYLAKRLGIPSVVGQVLGGALIASTPLHAVLAGPNAQVIDFLAAIGSVLLFFFVGLEISAERAKKNLKESLYISLFNTGVPLAAGFLFSRYALGLDFVSSLIVGISLCVSAIAVSLDVLEELGMLKSNLGNLIILAGTVGDILQSIIITLLLAVFQVSAPGLASVATGIFAFMLVVLALKEWVLPIVLARFEDDRSHAGLLGGALLITLFVAVVSESLGFSSLVGALVAGILTRSTLLSGANHQPWREHSLANQVHSLAFGFFVPIFFTSIGLGVNAGILSQSLAEIAVFCLLGAASMIVGTSIGVNLLGGSLKEGFVVGLGLLAKGDVELVIIALALENHLISGTLYSQLVATSMALALAGPLAFRHFASNYSRQAASPRRQQAYKKRKAKQV